MISKSPRLCFLLSLVSLADIFVNTQTLAAQSSACEFFWNHDRNGSEVYLQVAETWTLLHFLRNQPVLLPQWDSGQTHQYPVYLKVEWQPLPDEGSLPRLTKIGRIGGVAVYEVYYSPFYKVLVQERENWTFCLVWSWAVDKTSKRAVEPSTLFNWEDREYLSTRVFIPGMGALQESYFFSFHEGQVRNMKVDYEGMRSTLESQGWELYHRNGGFREARLEWQNWAWKRGTSGRVTLRVVFTRLGRSLVMKDTVILPEEELWKKDELGY